MTNELKSSIDSLVAESTPNLTDEERKAVADDLYSMIDGWIAAPESQRKSFLIGSRERSLQNLRKMQKKEDTAGKQNTAA